MCVYKCMFMCRKKKRAQKQKTDIPGESTVDIKEQLWQKKKEGKKSKEAKLETRNKKNTQIYIRIFAKPVAWLV